MVLAEHSFIYLGIFICTHVALWIILNIIYEWSGCNCKTKSIIRHIRIIYDIIKGGIFFIIGIPYTDSALVFNLQTLKQQFIFFILHYDNGVIWVSILYAHSNGKR